LAEELEGARKDGKTAEVGAASLKRQNLWPQLESIFR
jgi:hypothetical protein